MFRRSSITSFNIARTSMLMQVNWRERFGAILEIKMVIRKQTRGETRTKPGPSSFRLFSPAVLIYNVSAPRILNVPFLFPKNPRIHRRSHENPYVQESLLMDSNCASRGRLGGLRPGAHRGRTAQELHLPKPRSVQGRVVGDELRRPRSPAP